MQRRSLPASSSWLPALEDTPTMALEVETSAGRFHLTFTQGFLAGQLSVVILALLAIRYVIFEDSSSSSRSSASAPGPRGAWPARAGAKRDTKGTKRRARGVDDDNDGELDIAKVMADILARTSYDVASHLGESLDWVNVVVAQALAGYRDDVQRGGWSGLLEAAATAAATEGDGDRRRTARDVMEEVLNRNTLGRGIGFLDPIEVTDVQFGQSYPIFTNARVRPADASGRMVRVFAVHALL